jgi:hypothetical protein
MYTFRDSQNRVCSNVTGPVGLPKGIEGDAGAIFLKSWIDIVSPKM